MIGIAGQAILNNECESIPKEGLSERKLRIEVADESTPNTAWIAELTVAGALPWKTGETRDIELRIMSSEFMNLVERERPCLLFSHGNEILGMIEISGKET